MRGNPDGDRTFPGPDVENEGILLEVRHQKIGVDIRTSLRQVLDE